MQLIRLEVLKNSSVIREVKFKSGINIITNSESDGNQIGKSTTLRVINFCLGSDGVSIWKDPDTSVTNQKIYDLVTGGGVVFHLTLKVNGVPYEVKRTIEQKINKNGRVSLKRFGWIDNEPYNSMDKFKLAVAKIFGYEVNKPSYSSVKNKFVRLDKSCAGNIFKFLNHHTQGDVYTLIYSHLFGFEGHRELEEELALTQEKKTIESRSLSLLNGKGEEHYLDKIRSLDDEINILLSKEETYDIAGIQNEAIEKLRIHRAGIALLSNEIAGIETKILYNNRTVDNYRSKITNVDVKSIVAIYEEAVSLVPGISKTLAETIDFHNLIFVRKAEYVEKQTEILDSELKLKKDKLNSKLSNEKELVKSISNEGHLSGFILIEKAIQEKREERGRFSYVFDEVRAIRERVLEIEKTIITLRSRVDEYMVELHKNLSIFNDASKLISERVFKSFSIYLDARKESDNALKFSVINEDKVSGDGAPRAASMAFDMAMVEYVKNSGANLPAFTLQDYLESADEYKLKELTELANEMKIQTVISILNDKLHLLSDKFMKENVVLWLSTDNKFFKV